MIAQFIPTNWDRMIPLKANQSKLVQRISKLGTCQSYQTFNTCYKNTGLFGFYLIASERDQVDELTDIFQHEWTNTLLNATEVIFVILFFFNSFRFHIFFLKKAGSKIDINFYLLFHFFLLFFEIN